MRMLIALVLLGLPLSGRCATAAGGFDAGAARAKAHALTPCVSRGESGPLWLEFEASMRAAMRDSPGFDQTLRSIAANSGVIDSVLDERVETPQPGLLVYVARCRFPKLPVPFERLLAHLPPGSLRFEAGDRVPADAEVGRCGNSGNTSEPRLHFHLQDGPKPFGADGLPVQFSEFLADGKPVGRGEIVKGQRVRRAK